MRSISARIGFWFGSRSITMFRWLSWVSCCRLLVACRFFSDGSRFSLLPLRFHSKRRAVCVGRDHYPMMLTLPCRCFIKRFDRSTYPRLVGTRASLFHWQADSQDFELTRNRNSGRTAGRRSVNFVGSTKTSRRLRLLLSRPGDSGRLDEPV